MSFFIFIFLVTYRNKLVGNSTQVFSILNSPDFASILWRQKNLILRFDSTEIWLTKSFLESLTIFATDTTYTIYLAGKVFT